MSKGNGLQFLVWMNFLSGVSKSPRIQETGLPGDELLTLPVVVDIDTGPVKRVNVGWLPSLSTQPFSL
jgi:hypothetical protein